MSTSSCAAAGATELRVLTPATVDPEGPLLSSTSIPSACASFLEAAASVDAVSSAESFSFPAGVPPALSSSAAEDELLEEEASDVLAVVSVAVSDVELALVEDVAQP